MRRSDLHGWGPWVFCAIVVLASVLTVAAPAVIPFSTIAIPVLACSVLGRPALTTLVAAMTVVLGVGILAAEQYDDIPAWRRLLVIAVAVAVAFAVTWTIASWKRRLHEQADTFRLLAENILDAVIAVRLDGTITWASPSIEGLLDYSPDELVGSDARRLIARDDLDRVGEEEPAILAGAGNTYPVMMLPRSGDPIRVEVTPRPMRDEAGEVVGVVVAIHDVEEHARTREALEHEMEFDGLTGLAKRRLALERVEATLAGRPDGSWRLMCVGVNGLTSINHAYSHRGGDAVLQAVASRLVTAVGSDDRVARIAGDEFIVIEEDIVNDDQAARAAEWLLTAVRGPLVVDQTPIHVTVSVGVAASHGSDAESLLADATAAMRDATRMGPDHWAFVEGDVGARAREAMLLQASLRDALAAGHLVPWFMPVVSLATDQISGYEALVRWVHEDGRVTMPDDFLSLADNAGLLPTVDRAVFAAVIRQSGERPDAGEFSINVSAATLETPGFSLWMAQDVRDAGVDPRRIHLEVTETALFRVAKESVLEMRKLADLGMSWWVDDFGTGFSSISHLRDLPIAGLKLDRSFTADVTTEGSRGARLAEGLAGLAEGLGLSTIAEGVESIEQARALHAQGWLFGQGWYYGEPAPLPPAARASRDG